MPKNNNANNNPEIEDEGDLEGIYSSDPKFPDMGSLARQAAYRCFYRRYAIKNRWYNLNNPPKVPERFEQAGLKQEFLQAFSKKFTELKNDLLKLSEQERAEYFAQKEIGFIEQADNIISSEILISEEESMNFKKDRLKMYYGKKCLHLLGLKNVSDKEKEFYLNKFLERLEKTPKQINLVKINGIRPIDLKLEKKHRKALVEGLSENFKKAIKLGKGTAYKDFWGIRAHAGEEWSSKYIRCYDGKNNPENTENFEEWLNYYYAAYIDSCQGLEKNLIAENMKYRIQKTVTRVRNDFLKPRVKKSLKKNITADQLQEVFKILTDNDGEDKILMEVLLEGYENKYNYLFEMLGKKKQVGEEELNQFRKDLIEAEEVLRKNLFNKLKKEANKNSTSSLVSSESEEDVSVKIKKSVLITDPKHSHEKNKSIESWRQKEEEDFSKDNLKYNKSEAKSIASASDEGSETEMPSLKDILFKVNELKDKTLMEGAESLNNKKSSINMQKTNASKSRESVSSKSKDYPIDLRKDKDVSSAEISEDSAVTQPIIWSKSNKRRIEESDEEREDAKKQKLK